MICRTLKMPKAAVAKGKTATKEKGRRTKKGEHLSLGGIA